MALSHARSLPGRRPFGAADFRNRAMAIASNGRGLPCKAGLPSEFGTFGPLTVPRDRFAARPDSRRHHVGFTVGALRGGFSSLETRIDRGTRSSSAGVRLPCIGRRCCRSRRPQVNTLTPDSVLDEVRFAFVAVASSLRCEMSFRKLVLCPLSYEGRDTRAAYLFVSNRPRAFGSGKIP